MNVQEEARRRWDSVAKPLHSLGLLEDLVVRIAGIQGTENVCIDHRCALVFCGDHGVVRQGVSQTDSSVTALVAKAIGEDDGRACHDPGTGGGSNPGRYGADERAS